MKSIIHYGKQLAGHLGAAGELIINESVNNILTGLESFEAHDGRMHRSKFGNADDILSSGHAGFVIDGQRSLTRKMSYEGVYLQGPTGAGKTSHQIIPSVLNMTQSSLIIHDPSSEIFEKTSAYLAREGYKIYCLNFGNPKASHAYNPLSYDSSESDIDKTCALLNRTVLGTSSSDPFWSLQSSQLTKTMAKMVLKHDEELRNFANVRFLLKTFAGSQDKIDKLFAKKSDENLWADYLTIKALEPKVLSSVIATSLACTSLWSDQDICRVTASNSFHFSQCRKERVAIYLQNSTSDARYYSVLISLFFEQLMRYLLSEKLEKNSYDTFVILDELSTLFIPILSLAVTNVRKARCGMFLTLQSYESLQQAYGSENAEVIRSNCLSHIYLTGSSLGTSEQLERYLGREEIIKENKSVIKPLMFAEEVRKMDRRHALVFQSAHPYKVQLTPYYKQAYLRRKTELQPAALNFPSCSTPLKYIPL